MKLRVLFVLLMFSCVLLAFGTEVMRTPLLRPADLTSSPTPTPLLRPSDLASLTSPQAPTPAAGARAGTSVGTSAGKGASASAGTSADAGTDAETGARAGSDESATSCDSASSTQHEPRSEEYIVPGEAFILHGGEHEVKVDTKGPGKTAVRITATNLNTGDTFTGDLPPSFIRSVAPAGFPSTLKDVEGFQTFLANAFGKEAGKEVEFDQTSSGASISCSSQQEGNNFVVRAVLTLGKGLLANELPVAISLPLTHRSTEDEKHRIELRRLRDSFSKQLEAQARAFEHRLQLLSLQLNERVFLGVTHSIHIKATKLVMVPAHVRPGVPSRYTSSDESDSNFQNPEIAKTYFEKCKAENGQFILQQSYQESRRRGCVVRFVPDVHTIERAGLFATESEVIPQLPPSALAPLQLCRDLQSLSVFGHQITELGFLAKLPELTELSLNDTQIRDLSPLATLPKLRTLRLTHLNLTGGGGVDVSPLATISTLEHVYFTDSPAISKIDALAKIAGLRHLDTRGTRVADRTAFADKTRLKIVPE